MVDKEMDLSVSLSEFIHYIHVHTSVRELVAYLV